MFLFLSNFIHKLTIIDRIKRQDSYYIVLNTYLKLFIKEVLVSINCPSHACSRLHFSFYLRACQKHIYIWLDIIMRNNKLNCRSMASSRK